jgi:two-component system sensor histidine kinase KdpD
VAAPTEPVRGTLSRFALLVAAVTLLATAAAYAMGWRLAGMALRPTREITEQAEAIEAGTLAARITAHADVLEFGRLVTVLNAMLNRLDRAFQAQRSFTADASHELRGPLNVLRGDLEVTLKRERSPSEYRETLERCRQEVVQLSRLAADLLVLARSDAGLPLEQQIEVDLYALTSQVAQRYRPLASERNVRFHITGASATVLGDPNLLERVLANLIDNALRYAPDSPVRVTAGQVGDRVLIAVIDEGPGIPRGTEEQLFAPFQRLGDHDTSIGVGLGLSVARGFVEAMGGTISATDTPGGGLTAEIDLAAPKDGS